jgi:alginate O-acetyltransferase complex protein AlgI
VIFTELVFFLFFALAFSAYWAVPSGLPRKLVLFFASAVFYSAWNWRFLPLLLAITLVDYLAAIFIRKSQSAGAQKGILAVSLTANLALLGVFKYFDFFVASAQAALMQLGFGARFELLELIIPLGISFHTLQAMSYTIDVFRKKAEPVTSLLDFSLFISFFPQLVAGPLVRAHDFFPSLNRKISLTEINTRPLLVLFAAGFFKKAVVADNLAPLIDAFFANPEAYSAASAWLALLLYAIQIYCDFSGYTDIAIACAGLLGFDLPANFQHPYLSKNIALFWRNWHISLSSWFKDYVYVPLGGGRSGSVFITFRNIMLTCTAAGLWHGANWKFVVWGVVHGLGLSFYRLFLETPGKKSGRLHEAAGILITFFWIVATIAFFRATDLNAVITVMKQAFAFSATGLSLLQPVHYIFLAVIAAFHFYTWTHPDWKSFARVPAGAFYFFFGIFTALFFSLANLNYKPFIYFQF